MYPCKYSANDNVKRFLESQGVRVELEDTSTTEDDIKEARKAVERCIEENTQKAREAIASVSERMKVDENDKKPEVKWVAPCQLQPISPKHNCWLRIKKLFKK